MATKNQAAMDYAHWTARSCSQNGIDFHVVETTKSSVFDEIRKANENPNVHGIIFYYPCFGPTPGPDGSSDEVIREMISVRKDVEALSQPYRERLKMNIRLLDSPCMRRWRRKSLLPCTPLAVVKILEYLKIHNRCLPIGSRINNKTISVFNRSEVVGRPLACMLANDGATVFSVDDKETMLVQPCCEVPTDLECEDVIKLSDVLVTGVPCSKFKLPCDLIRPGATIINLSSFSNVDEERLLQVPNVRYVPKVGKVTVCMLQRNLLKLIYNFHLNKDLPDNQDLEDVLDLEHKIEIQSKSVIH
ncbi:hypothetical protein GUITHDRAFT_157912 [Guillardia theta CCMP2712]|uniref:Methylenetetrahydrofolate dehydrogenase n=1 Tax=Guillardia theta (strain CCMP2712) TaxID=905079 RepID=L1J916_GUITC|nr:hypothetical protein GUITHDRAFT_157912 [Guillardia theta CCMP2712]EKX44787.1 hypothetical protein GUITHDRAFT_157912 [Guillardia theta CCMP2712]|eukprot:XP_005831767.1 hypothetical protein GUITHDRAFT_157912 [Guillardia theta CCMP2712]